MYAFWIVLIVFSSSSFLRLRLANFCFGFSCIRFGFRCFGFSFSLVCLWFGLSFRTFLISIFGCMVFNQHAMLSNKFQDTCETWSNWICWKKILALFYTGRVFTSNLAHGIIGIIIGALAIQTNTNYNNKQSNDMTQHEHQQFPA